MAGERSVAAAGGPGADPIQRIFFGHHKCATQYIKAVVSRVAAWSGMGFDSVVLVAQPSAAPQLCNPQGDVAKAELLYVANANVEITAALRQRGSLRGFHVIRDPRDILVSGYFSHRYSHPVTVHNRERMAVWRQQLAELPSVEEGLLRELEFAADNFANLAAWSYQQPDIHEVRYEALIADPLVQFGQIFRFLGFTTPRHGWGELADRLWRRYSMRPLRRSTSLPQPLLRRILDNHAFERKSGGRARGEEDVRHHYRKGVAGDWRNYFTPRVVAAFKDRYGPLLLQLGYERSSDW